MENTKKRIMRKEITTYSDICGFRTTLRLYDVSDGVIGQYQIIKTWKNFQADPCIWIYYDYSEALAKFKEEAMESASYC